MRGRVLGNGDGKGQRTYMMWMEEKMVTVSRMNGYDEPPTPNARWLASLPPPHPARSGTLRSAPPRLPNHHPSQSPFTRSALPSFCPVRLHLTLPSARPSVSEPPRPPQTRCFSSSPSRTDDLCPSSQAGPTQRERRTDERVVGILSSRAELHWIGLWRTFFQRG